MSKWTAWQTPRRKGYRFTCCDCGLTHEMDFRLRGPRNWRIIQFRVARDEHQTHRNRRHHGHPRTGGRTMFDGMSRGNPPRLDCTDRH